MAYTTKIESFDSLSSAWEELLQNATYNHIFFTPTWQRVWWEQLGRGNEPLLVSFREGGELIGVAPLMRRGTTLSLLGDADVCDYLDLVTRKGHEDGVCRALYDFLSETGWESLDLVPLRPDSVTVGHFIPLLEQKGCAVEKSQIDTSPEAALPGDWEQFLAGLSKKNRHELRRKMRRLESAGEVRHTCTGDPGSLVKDMEDFLALFKASREEKVAFLTPAREAYFRNLVQATLERNFLRLSFLELDGKRVAANLCFDYNGSIYLYNSGYDPGYYRLAVGLLHKAYCLRKAITSGKARFDFLRGAEPYKYDLGGEDVPIYRYRVKRP